MTSIASPSYHLTRSDLDDLASVPVARTDPGFLSVSDHDIDDIVSVASSYVAVYVDDVGRPVSEGGALIRVKKSNLGTTTTGRYTLVCVKPNESVAGDWEYHEVIDDLDDLDDIPLSPIVETGDPDSVPRPDLTQFPLLQFFRPLQPMPCKPCVLLV